MPRQAEGRRFRLPVSGRMVAMLPPSGQEDLLLVEAGSDAALSLALADRLMGAVDGEPFDWNHACVPDLDTFVVRLRQAMLGDRIRADLACPAVGCGRRIDIDFSAEQYLMHHAESVQSVPDAGCVLADEPGWFDSHLPERVRFRLPTVADQLAVAGLPDADEALAKRCIQPVDGSDGQRATIESAMALLAPTLSDELQGTCPECGVVVPVFFDARWFCLRELRQTAQFIYQDVDVLARRYHWSETEILALPRTRRAAYADLARQTGGA